MDVRWKHPFNCIVSAPTKSGKTEFVKKLILYGNDLIYPSPEKVYWCYTEWQPSYDDLLKKRPDIVFTEGMPDINELKAHGKIPKLLVMDDMMQEMRTDTRFTQLFTRGSHHWNLSIVHIVQNAFYEGLRTSRINAQYLVLMKNPADKLQVQTLGRQIFPGSKHFAEAFEDATSQPFGYLLIDLTQTIPENLRLRTNIFPDDAHYYVYTSK